MKNILDFTIILYHKLYRYNASFTVLINKKREFLPSNSAN